MNNLRYLLLQIRDERDPMRQQEVECFSRIIGCRPDKILVHDMLGSKTPTAEVSRCDIVLIGGSGDYSAVDDSDWLDRALDLMRSLHDDGKPTFASCWGFQAMARAMGL